MHSQFPSRSHKHRRLEWCTAAFLFLAAFPALARADQDAATQTASADQDAAAQNLASASSTNAAQSSGDEGETIGLLEEPRFISRGIGLARDRIGDGGPREKNGFYPEFSNMITGSGIVSVGPGYRHRVLGGKAFYDLSAAMSWHAYKMAQGTFEFPALAGGRLTVGTQAMFQDATQVSYFGVGNTAVSADQSQYRLKTLNAVGYATLRPVPWFALGGEVGWLKRPEVLETTGPFNPNYPDARFLHPNDPGMDAPFQPYFLFSHVSATADTRDYRSHPTGGGMYRAALTSYSDRDTGANTFKQYEGEAAHFVPLGDRRFVLAMHAWTVFSDVPADHEVPFYLLPSLGGNNTLRGFHTLQFHDQNLLLASAELRVAMFTHVDAAVFYDAGNVAARYTDLNFDKRSVGAGLRLHTERATFGRVDVAHGSEGWLVIFRTTDPFKFSRVSRKVASIPFTP